MINIGTAVNFLCNPSFVDNYNEDNKKSQPISVTFCIPGKDFTTGFFNSWTKLLFFIKNNPELITPHFVNYYTNELSSTLNEMLGGSDGNGTNQLPFSEDFESSLLFFLEPDKVFEPLQVMQIIYKMVKCNLGVLSGVYFEKDQKLSLIEEDSEEYYLKNKSLKKYNKEDLINLGKLSENSLCEVSNMGMGFVCINNGLFESINYPWFSKESISNSDEFYEVSHSLFRKFKNKKIDLYCDTSVFIQSDK
jgi:hypothetical protein